MVPNDALINALRSLNFSFKRQTDRVHLYKQRGTTLRVSVRRNAKHNADYAKAVLRQAGMSEGEIEKFISESGGKA